MQTISIKQTRDNLAELIEQVAIGKKTFIITKFGKPKARIMPIKDIDTKSDSESRRKTLEETFGVWKNRKDIKNSTSWVARLRHKMSSRYGKIFD